MSTVAAKPLTYGGDESFRRFTVAEYNQMIRAGVLGPDDKVELLEGCVVLKMPRTPKHDNAVDRVAEALYPSKPAGWRLRVQAAVTLSDSQPEPDLAFARGSVDTYEDRHPGPVDLGLVIEVAYTSLRRDTVDKVRIYAADGVPEYWVVNLVDRKVEAFTRPTAEGYTDHRTFVPGDALPLTLDGVTVATLAVADLLR